MPENSTTTLEDQDESNPDNSGDQLAENREGGENEQNDAASTVGVIAEETNDQVMLAPRITEALGVELKHFTDEEKQELQKLFKEADIPEKTQGSTRHLDRKQFKGMSGIVALCINKGVDPSLLAKLFDYHTPAAMLSPIRKYNSKCMPGKVIKFISDAEEEALKEIEARVIEMFESSNRITRDSQKELIISWLRLQRRKAGSQLFPADLRKPVSLPSYRTTKLEPEFKGRHLYDLIPQDIFNKYLKPEETESAVDAVVPQDETGQLDEGETSEADNLAAKVESFPEQQQSATAVPVNISANLDVIREIVGQNARVIAVVEGSNVTDQQAAVAQSLLDMNQKLLAVLTGVGSIQQANQVMPAASQNRSGRPFVQQAPLTAPSVSINGANITLDPTVQGTITILELGRRQEQAPEG